jgi:hypothetical protein
VSEFKFDKGATVLFLNPHGLLTDGQITDRWTDEYGHWYEVYDLSDPHADQHPLELPEDKLEAYR